MGKKKDVIEYEQNPFLAHTSEVVKIGYKTVWVAGDGDRVIVNRNTGETMGTVVGMRRAVDRQEFVKLYAEGVGAILNLKAAGKKVFQLIYEEISAGGGIGKDRIFLKYETLDDEIQAGMSRATFYNGIKDCLTNKIIAQTKMDTSLYFINPAFVFNGNRLTFLTQYEIETPIKPQKRLTADDE